MVSFFLHMVSIHHGHLSYNCFSIKLTTLLDEVCCVFGPGYRVCYVAEMGSPGFRNREADSWWYNWWSVLFV